MYTHGMATWHITVKTVWHSSFTASARDIRLLVGLRERFQQCGFTVSPMPENVSAGFSVSHTSESAITLYLLKYGAEHIEVEQIV